MKRQRVCLILTLALLLISASVASAGGNTNPGILPPNSRVQRMTYEQWSAIWWQQLFAIPTPENFMAGHYGPDCYFKRIGNVGLAVSGGGTMTIACNMPIGMKLFVPVLTAECSTVEPWPFYGGNEEELRACAHAFVPADLQASIDGVAVQSLGDYLVTSPLYQFDLPADNVLGVPGGGPADSVSYGVWLMLAPFTPGQHTVHVYGAYPDFGFIADITYEITVPPGR